MLEGLAAWVLNTYIGEYVENLNTAQLSIALLQGAVELENLPLKKDALKYLDLPLQVKSGFIGKITLQIPIRHLRSEPWVISIEKLYLVAGPYKHTQFDDEKTKKDEQKKKAAMLEALEKDWKIQKQEKQEGYGTSWFSYGTSIASNILENVQLKIKDVHIRYEDDQLIPSCPFAFGISIKSLSAISTNGQWEMKFVSHDESNMMHKMIDLQNFSVYLDTHATMLGSLSMSDLADALEREMFVSQRTKLFQDHEFILAPISAQTRLKRNTSALPLRSANKPRIELDVNLDEITACLSEDQYRCIIQWLKEIERHDRRRKCKRPCPTQTVSKSPRNWWKYAISVYRDRIREKNEHRTWSFVTGRVHDVLLYFKAYTVYLIGEQLSTRMTADKNRIEEEFSFEELRIIRDLAYRKVKEQGALFKVKPVTEKPPPETEQKGYLQSWFPGWGGWGGTSSQTPTPSSSATELAREVGEPPTSKKQEEELEQEIMEVIQETSENTSFLKKDIVFALMHFTLNSGSFKLLCSNPAAVHSLNEHPSNVTMVELECSLINMMFESRPRSSAMKYGLSLGSLYLRDKITENSTFPCLISPQARERRLSLSGSFSGGLASPRTSKSAEKSTSDTTLEHPQHSASTDSFFKYHKEDKLFELMYEKNPTSTDASYKLSINTKPLDLIYNPATVRRIREFFSSRNKGIARISKLQLTAEARRRYEVFKEQTKAELRNTLDQILAGDESVKTKKWVVDLDISAPQILIPENFLDTAARMVILDLGHLSLYNKKIKPRQDSDVIEEDEFKTPLSTPPSEAEPEETPSLTQLTEAEIYDKLYDRYTLELSDLQVMVGRARDNWKHARNRGSSHLHVIDKFSINLQFEKRLIYTTDPQYPSTTMTATLPRLTFHVNEHKVSALRHCVSIITQPSHSATDLSASASSMSFGDTVEAETIQTKQSLPIGKESKREQKLKEVDEFSRLMFVQFSINMVSLEIQSRGRPIAELQVTKVKANMIKRPYDTSIGLTVHSLLVVDALQTYGHDFELLIASHRGVRLDSKSGSIMGSDPASPTSPTSPQSPRSPAEMISPPTSTTSLQTVQEAISKAFKTFVTGDSPAIDKTHSHHLSSSGTTDTEAIIKLDLEIISEHSPSNANGCDKQIANLLFSNLDIVANQETMVELISFVNLVIPTSEEVAPPLSKYTSQPSLNMTLEQKQSKQASSKLEVTADFHRLNILMMRLESIKGYKQARKVATATMSSAQLQATIGNDLVVSGSLGGFHILDVTPDAGRHYHIFSVGSEETKNLHCDSMLHSVMYKTAHESMLVNDTGNKALQCSFIKGFQQSTTIEDFTLDTSQFSDNSGQKITSVNVQIASMCYLHSPRLLNEVTQCVSEFTDFMKSVASSIKTAASEVAKGIMTKNSDMSMYGSTTGMDFTKSNFSINNDDEINEYFKGSHILLNAQLETPVIVFPRSTDSPDVLVANLGHISIKNFDALSQDLDEEESAPTSTVRMFVEAKDMNLYSLNIDKHMELHKNFGTESIFDTSIYRNSDFGLPIVHDTTVEILLEHVQPEPIIINVDDTDDWCFNGEQHKSNTRNVHTKEMCSFIDVTACIATPLKVELSQSVYEQILQSSDNLTYNENIHGILNIATDQREKSKEQPDQNTSIKQMEPVSKTIGHQKPTKAAKDADSVVKVMFKVPILNIEMKGEFDEGYKGLVNINLQDFVLNMKKENPYSTEIQVHLKTLIMEDLLEDENSEHRFLLISKQVEDKNKPQEPKLFLSQSCPDSCIIAPIPVMPHSLPSSFHKDLDDKPDKGPDIHWNWKQNRSSRIIGIPKFEKKSSYPCTPPPSMRASRRGSTDKSTEDDLVHINLTLIDKFSPEYVDKYNKTNRFIDVDFNCLEANVNLQTWVVLLDFLGLGAKIHDEDTVPNEASPKIQKDLAKPDEPSVNSVVNLKVKSFSLRLNKPEYELSRAQISQLSSHITTRDGNLTVTGQLGSISLTDQSPHGELYRERFMTIGHQALVFDVFKYGLPDPGLQREYDIKVNLKMASVRYVHTNRFQSELVAFIQHFLQLQDVLGRIKAASAGKKVADKASRGSRILLDIEAQSPIIVIPHSSQSNDVLVADLGNLTLKNVFKHDGTDGTLSAIYRPVIPESVSVKRNLSNDSLLSRNSTDTSQPGSLNMMTQSVYNDILPPMAVSDPMTSSIYGSLEKDERLDDDIDDDESEINEFEVYDPTIETPKTPEGSSVDPNFLLDTSSSGSLEYPKRNLRKTDSDTSCRDTNFRRNLAGDNFLKVNSDGSVSSEGPDYICLLDVMSVILSDMDLYSAERVDKQVYNRSFVNSKQTDLVFTDCVMHRQEGNSLKEKCMLKLQIERNLENDISHAVPDFRINGALSSMHITIDTNQYKLIRGILDHNLGEKLPEFQKALMSHLMDPKIHTVLSGTVWQNIGMAIDLKNVTIELVTSHDQGPEYPESSLAKLDFISSTFRFDSFSNQAKDVDLVSHEIVVGDTRYRDAPVNVRPNVFDKILQPGPIKSKKYQTSEYESFQLELHFRSTKDSNQFSVLLNNMKLMCIFDWLITVKEFLTTKPDDPFNPEGDDVVNDAAEGSDIPVSPKPGSRTCSPLNMSSGVMTKRGPIVEQVEVPFELKLNVSNTQFVVVEDCTTWDTNAVILKSTAVLTYRPSSQDKLLSCSLQSIEVFSCSLLSEEETALSIIDPLMINIDLNANPLPDLGKSLSTGLLEASEIRQKNLLLEISLNTMNIRLSYLDMKMFLAILNSLPDQALKAKNRELQTTQTKYSLKKMKCLKDLGFSDKECEKALDRSNGDLTEAALWLTQHGKPLPVEKKTNQQNLTCIELKAICICLCFIDDCKDSDVPLAELSFSNINIQQKLHTVMEGQARFSLTGDYYNRELSGWEPFIEPWRCSTEWTQHDHKGDQKRVLQINAPDVLNINITRTLLDLYNKTKDKWTEDYYKQVEPANSTSKDRICSSSSDTSTGGNNQRRRTPFVPFVLDNQTGCPLWYLKVTTHPSRIKPEIERRDEMIGRGYIQATDWKKVQPGQQVSFEFNRPQKIRHEKSHDLHVNQIVVKVNGWHRLSAVSVDKVGVYFRETEPDKKSATGLNAISYDSWHDPAKQHLARVVFDVRQEGSARKVITIRSALTISNKIDSSVDVRMMAGNALDGKFEIIQVKPMEIIPIPLPFICATLHMKPSDWPVKFCDHPIQWQHVALAGDTKEKINKCRAPDNSGIFRFCSSVHRENFPEQILTREDIPILPAHTITILPPVIIHNLLPIDMRYYLTGTDISGVVKPGKKADLHAADPQKDMTLGIHVENFDKCKELLIPPDSNRNHVKLRLLDREGRKLNLLININSMKSGSVNISVLSSFWLINKSGLPLVFGQTETEAAGQFEEHELARSVTPLLFSFTDNDAADMCTMRIGKSVHGPDSIPLWCNKFSLDSGVGVRKLNIVPRERNKPDWLVQLQNEAKLKLRLSVSQRQVYNIGIAVQQGRGRYKDTNIVNFAPRFEIDNQSSHKLAIAQRHIAMEEMEESLGTYLTALPHGKMPFHFPRLDYDQLLCVRMIDKENYMWSGGFLIDRVSSFHVNMRDQIGNSHLLKVEIVLEGPTFHIIFVDAEEFPPPFRIDNHSEVPVLYNQSGLTKPYQKSTIKPKSSLPYTWDEPTMKPLMTMYAQGGSKTTYNLDKLEEGEQLCYENFIFLAATSTFGSEADDLYSDLVLEVVQDNNIVFRKKAIGNRSQLWRMTGAGMLEHEGSMVPRDPRKSSSSSKSLVLDTNVIAPQPGKYAPLTLKKPDNRRTSTQIWTFTDDGRLCCASGILCVQALGGILQEGTIAVSGPGPSTPGLRVGNHMQIARQKLRPGSGYLSVRVLMDGPIRVLEIADIQNEHLLKSNLTEENGWEIYEETSIQSKESEISQQQERKTMELSMSLKGGLGISLINRFPEELVYISLCNITMDYISTPEKVNFDISVSNIQVDNQLLDAQKPVMLFDTRTSKKDVPDNTPALHIVAHKIPSTKWNADIYKHLIISMKKLNVHIEERLLWKLFQFGGFGQTDVIDENLDETDYDTRQAIAAVTSVKAKRYYFGTIKINTSRVTLSMCTSKLTPELRSIRTSVTSGILASFEDAKVDLESFVRHHPFETSAFLTREIIQHFTEGLKSQAAKLLGSVDFLGNPLGLFNDVTEGISGLIKDGNVGGLLKNVTHGVSNSAAKFTGSLSDSLGILNFDDHHNERREELKISGTTSRGGHLLAGIKGLGYGLKGGLFSIPKQFYEGAREEGIGGAIMGTMKGAVGMVPKFATGVLDLASGAANAIKDTSQNRPCPPKVRETRCCHGPGGLLPSYSKRQAEHQRVLHKLMKNKHHDIFIAMERLRASDKDGLLALITNRQVYFLRPGSATEDNIIFQVPYRGLKHCHTVKSKDRYYIELVLSKERSPHVQCDKHYMAQKTSQQINYARNLYDEQRHTVMEYSTTEFMD